MTTNRDEVSCRSTGNFVELDCDGGSLLNTGQKDQENSINPTEDCMCVRVSAHVCVLGATNKLKNNPLTLIGPYKQIKYLGTNLPRMCKTSMKERERLLSETTEKLNKRK